ncbi:MAG: hypothetical protein QOD04_6069 [Pseudonocardiales bacterium]|nr:hypothetical protein [Pseudonocardiales bacterium]
MSAENLPGVQLGNNGASLRIHGERALKTPRAVTPRCAEKRDSVCCDSRLARTETPTRGQRGIPGSR